MHVILGAGLSGLSLAAALVRAGVEEPIEIIDRRSQFTRDRTWCTWALPDTPWLECASHTWNSWSVRAHGRTATSHSAAHPYLHIPADAFYDAALSELRRARNVRMRLGETVLAIGDGWARTDRGEVRGSIYDALALGSPNATTSGVELWQTFLGWEVRTDEPTFDPAEVTLMDFDVEQDGNGVHFLYVLPFSATHALVEHTTFAPRAPSRTFRERALRARLPRGFDRIRTEHGRLPMTIAPLNSAPLGEGLNTVGVAGGALRASSGYAFTRIQHHAQAIASAVAERSQLPPRAGAQHRAAQDAVFLHALTNRPDAFAAQMRSLFDRVDGDVLARFMTDAAGARDELRVMAALPAGPFGLAAAQVLTTRLLRTPKR